MDICIFGASITQGFYDFAKGGWADRIKEYCYKNNKHYVYNLGISGETTSDLLFRFRNEAIVREPQIIIMSIGINDSAWSVSNNKHLTPIGKFVDNLKELIRQSIDLKSKIIIVGLTPVDESRTKPIAWNKDIVYQNDYIEKYNDLIKNVCKEKNIKFIDLYDYFINKSGLAEILVDGVHPNSQGHEEIFNVVIRELSDDLK